jgi:putative endonuclease
MRQVEAEQSFYVTRKVPMEYNTWHVYLMECADGTLYCGITKDPARRLDEHNGILPGGAKYTSGRRPVKMLASRMCATKGEALKLELAIKSCPRQEKLRFLETYTNDSVIADCPEAACVL